MRDAQKYRLIHNQFDLNSWVDSSFLEQVLKEEQLSSYWPARPVRASTEVGKLAAAPPAVP